MNAIDVRLVGTQIVGFLLMLWLLRKFAWGPLVGMFEARREKISADFREAERAKSEAAELKSGYEQKLRGGDAEARARILEAVTEGQRVAAEIKAQAQSEAVQRLERAADEMARERDKAKERIKEQVVHLSIRTAEKILKQKLDAPAQRKLAAEFIDEVGALK
ncbi:MAG: F0F1 ATP synthase subunit B [Candidatus Eisenbacteria bacterium]|nr:F0F1 ATP synthase subunit B [Candidatus Eisenbacteria bacterium]